MRVPLIGGSRHGQTVVVSGIPLDYIELAEEPLHSDPRGSYRVERYRRTDWVYRDFRRTVERPVYLHSSIAAKTAYPYIDGWFETGVITPLEVPNATQR